MYNPTLDGKTRPEHRKLDGEIRELEEKFSNGLMYPCDRAGKAADVINCRCLVMQETRWALDEDELQTLKDRAAYFGLDKTKDFEDFKTKYLKAADTTVPQAAKTTSFVPAKTIEEAEEYARAELGFSYVKYGKTDVDVANTINKTIIEIQTRFPEINVDRIVESPKNAKYYLAMEKTNYFIGKGVTAGTIDLGSFEWKTLAELEEKIIKDIETGWLAGVAEKPLESVIWHEYAHQYGSVLEAKTFGNIEENYTKYLNSVGKKQYYKELVKKAKKTAKAEGWDFDIKNISRYAAKNESEAFAEAFADININLKPARESKMLMKVAGILDETAEKVVENSVKSSTIRIQKSLGAAAKNYQVKLADSKQHVKLSENQEITGHTFAGKGTKKEIRERFRLESDYKIPADEWQKISGNGTVIVDGKQRKVELHWYEAEGEIYEMKVKRYLDES